MAPRVVNPILLKGRFKNCRSCHKFPGSSKVTRNNQPRKIFPINQVALSGETELINFSELMTLHQNKEKAKERSVRFWRCFCSYCYPLDFEKSLIANYIWWEKYILLVGWILLTCVCVCLRARVEIHRFMNREFSFEIN